MPPRWSRDTFDAPKAKQTAAEKEQRIERLTAEFNTEEPDELAAMLVYLLYPLDVLRGNAPPASDVGSSAFTLVADQKKVDEHLQALSLATSEWNLGIDDRWRVITTIHNHHRGLNPRINMFSATVSTEEETVAQTVHKENKKKNSS